MFVAVRITDPNPGERACAFIYFAVQPAVA
jgi:hypothetical protein